MYYAGLDAGSTYLKAALIKDNEVIATGVENSGISNNENATNLINMLCEKARIKIDDLGCIMSTGYSRRSLDIAKDNVSEITAHAFGVQLTSPEGIKPGLIIDIGGQDSKVICLNNDGLVKNFVMNDKCAAGTGKFIEVIAQILDTTIDKVGPLSKESLSPCDINSTCVVFAQTEVISLIARKKKREDILAGMHQSMAKRIGKMGRKFEYDSDIVMTGGGAKNSGLVEAFEDELMTDVFVANHPQFNGAIGAAVYSRYMANKGL
ncbi:acyl-CoA dehydratase activase [Clostridium aestuarii]|uniref:Acyl-CoA dehydratase activase n=1 Tax=Clostridium aestuarii TaxID=338193 RepID=A0ABT4D053_9CLOT|nr:acyl-CoA dehydratase activase [Clostridium aestuarii]MCY6484619.1 acyl-CoA dehydratase activase [Clostridium aestuarii]